MTRQRKPKGYWEDIENVISEARAYIEQFGAAEFTQRKLAANGYRGIDGATRKHGGFAVIRQHLGLTLKSTKPKGYWDDIENVISEAGAYIEQFGAAELTKRRLVANGYGCLDNGIIKHGGINAIRQHLGLTLNSTKPKGYWDDIENVIREAGAYIEQFGAAEFTHHKLVANGYGCLNNGIIKHGGINAIRQHLGLKPLRQPRAQRRQINLQAIKQFLRNLEIEWHSAELSAAQLLIILQQGKFDQLALGDGGDLFQQLSSGSLPAEVIAAWVDSEDPELPGLPPTVEPGLPQEPELPPTVELPAPTGSQPQEQPEQQLLPALALMDPAQQFRLLDADVFAADDTEAIAAISSITLHRLWAKAYLGPDQEQQVLAACRQFSAKRPWTAALQQRFIAENAAAHALQLPASYRFAIDGLIAPPNLMQRHVAAQAIERRRLICLSSVGTGKTLAGQLAAMADGAQRILVVSINACAEQWRDTFTAAWGGVTAVVSPTPPTVTNTPVVWVLPTHRLSLMDDSAVAAAAGFSPDAVIIDEVHTVKQRYAGRSSKRREQLSKVLSICSAANPELMVIGMSATGVINNLTEARKLLELVNGEQRGDLPTEPGAANAMKMHMALMASGIRQKAHDAWPERRRTIEVDASHLLPEAAQARAQGSGGIFHLERVLLQAKIPAVVKAIAGPTVVATQYVDGFIEPLRQAIEAAGYRVGVHTGGEKLPVAGHGNAIEAFKAGAVDVLLASIDTLGTGVDGLQHICHRMVIASLPWTAASEEQLIGRLARAGQRHTVEVVTVTTAITYQLQDGTPEQWRWCQHRLDGLQHKRRLMDAAMDGLLPDDVEELEGRAKRELRRWIERIEANGVVVRR